MKYRISDALKVLLWRKLTAEDMDKCRNPGGIKDPYKDSFFVRMFYMDGESPSVDDVYMSSNPGTLASLFPTNAYERKRVMRVYTPKGDLKRKRTCILPDPISMMDQKIEFLDEKEIEYDPPGRFWGKRVK